MRERSIERSHVVGVVRVCLGNEQRTKTDISVKRDKVAHLPYFCLCQAAGAGSFTFCYLVINGKSSFL